MPIDYTKDKNYYNAAYKRQRSITDKISRDHRRDSEALIQALRRVDELEHRCEYLLHALGYEPGFLPLAIIKNRVPPSAVVLQKKIDKLERKE